MNPQTNSDSLEDENKRSKWWSNFDHKFWIVLFFLVVILGVFIRIYGLDERTYHHDESIHAIFAHKTVITAFNE